MVPTKGMVAHLSIFYTPLDLVVASIWGLGSGSSVTGGERKIIVSEAGVTREKARRVLQAAAVEAFGRPGAYVIRDPVMRRAGISDLEEFWAIAEYLDRRGWIAETDADYGIFVLTPQGIDEATS